MFLNLKDIYYSHPNREELFRNIHLSIGAGDKSALIGNNGSGKSTLLRLAAGLLTPSRGEITASGETYYIPQHFGQYNHLALADALGIGNKIRALRSILKGEGKPDDFDILDDDWTIEERALSALDSWGISSPDLFRRMESLSGGEKTKIFLAGISMASPSYLLLDEPSNHLDREGRKRLYAFVENSSLGMLMVSHDRTLLNLVDYVYELEEGKIRQYGGNYDFYKCCKEEQVEAFVQQMENREKELKKARVLARKTAEKKQKADIRGKEKKKKEGVSRIAMRTLKDNAENTSSRLKGEHENKLNTMEEQLREMRKNLPANFSMKPDVENANLHQGKILVTGRKVNYSYGTSFVWGEPIDFQLVSGDRILIKGKNGSGKTTLLNLIVGKIAPNVGEISRTGFHYLYIDQEYSLIDSHSSVWEFAQECNGRHLQEHELKIILHRFLFTRDMWDRPCHLLSGGEKMRLLFCGLTLRHNVPDMIILDEPANNLDLQSQQILVDMVSHYRGTVLLVSHDPYFIGEIGIEKEICLSDC